MIFSLYRSLVKGLEISPFLGCLSQSHEELKSEDRRQRTRRTEIRGQKTEGRGQKAEDRGQRAKV
jgi:hypothetical protein